MNQAALAEKIKKSRNSVCNWERGVCYPDAGTLREIADLFNVSVRYLCGDSNMRYAFAPLIAEDIDMSVLNIDGMKKLKEYYELLLHDERYTAENKKV